MLEAQVVVTFIPTLNRLRTSKEIAHIAEDHMVTALQHGEVKLRLMPPEARAPDPGFTIGDFFRDDYLTGNLTKLEVDLLVTVKGGFFP